MNPKINEQIHWFVMRDARPATSSDLVYKKLLAEGIEVFTPLKWTFRTINGKRVRTQTPIIHPLLFLRSSKNEINQLRISHPKLQFIFQRGQTQEDLGMTVRDIDMRHFRLALEMQREPVYYQPGEITPSMVGAQIVIVNGPLKGFVGNLYKYKGRGHKVIVKLADFISTTVQVSEGDFNILQETDSPDNLSAYTLLFTLFTDLTDLLDVLCQKNLEHLSYSELQEYLAVYQMVAELFDKGVKPSNLPSIHSIPSMLDKISAEINRRPSPFTPLLKPDCFAEAPSLLKSRVSSLCTQILNSL